MNPIRYDTFELKGNIDVELMLDTHCSNRNATLELYAQFADVEEGGLSSITIPSRLVANPNTKPLTRRSVSTFDFSFGTSTSCARNTYAIVREKVSSVALSYEDVPKLKEFVGTKSTCNVDNFLWRMENYFRAKGITDDAVKINTASMFLTNIALLWWWRGRTTDKRQSESVVKLGLGKNKLRSSKFEERGVCEKDRKEDNVSNGISDNGVMDHSSKPVTIAPNASSGGLLCR
ncbi:hypothetical protein J1N35_037192 [Gossypium stocksii]|uniref:Uncharacterized protein n=1 Tax=Gossypium stocksii TaxID=47602 RepID=A0A9D3UJP2_9ROSI|nr:hypothetical protein J1N35_037192 [Gossypium stocksii]